MLRVNCEGEKEVILLHIKADVEITAESEITGEEFLINGSPPFYIYQNEYFYDNYYHWYVWKGQLEWKVPANKKCGESLTLIPSATTGCVGGQIEFIKAIFEQCEDKDNDGHYAISATCSQGDDCDDNDATIYPGAPELCDGWDNDCDGQVDNLCPSLSVPLYKQCASPWGTDIYDHTTATICKKGCALTSAVMVLRYYGVTTGIDGKEVNPRNLNEWLIVNNGYAERGAVKWDKISKYSGSKVIFTTVYGRNDETLKNDLCNGRPAIVNVPNHFVVAIGAMCVDNETTWTINDPGRNITTLQGYGNTYLGLRRTRFQ